MSAKATIPRVCAWCSTPFLTTDYQLQNGHGRCCGRSCAARLRGGRKRTPLADRLWAKVDKHGPLPMARPDLGPCWIWLGKLDGHGYGQISEGGRQSKKVSVHSLVYKWLVGPITDGLEPDHLCRIRRCCNPEHLDPVTRRENVLRGESPAARNARKTHCVNGHPFDEANTIVRAKGRGRECRICAEAAWRRYGDKRGPRRARKRV